MNEDRIHRAVSADGTEIAGRVQGQGPPLVLVPAGPGDCETTWRYVLPLLSERFTCYLLNTRGRGASADDPDHSPRRLVEDVIAFTESIGEPAGLVEWGSFVGAGWSLVAAQHTSAILAVASYDPLVIGVASEEDAARLHGVFGRVGELAAEGRLADAARGFVAGLAEHGYYTDEDMADGATSDFWTASAPNIPMFFGELEQAEEAGGPDPADPSTLTATTVPVLLLHGARSHPMNIAFVRYVADHLADVRVRGVAGAGHYGPHTHPEAVTDELTRFFGEARQRVPRTAPGETAFLEGRTGPFG
jgi:pimeloyl-ACP methyl ester carboxylesterase